MDEAEALLATIDQGAWTPIGESENARRVQQYGVRYNHSAAAVQRDPADPIPDWCAAIGERILAEGHMDAAPEQVIINEYFPGQGIASHVDHPEGFGPVVVSITLGSAVTMDYTAVKSGDRHEVYLENGSLVAMRGPARYGWKHGIAKRNYDMVEGKRIPRERRVSLTFRTLQ